MIKKLMLIAAILAVVGIGCLHMVDGAVQTDVIKFSADNSTMNKSNICLSVETSSMLGGAPTNLTTVAAPIVLNGTATGLTLNATGTWMIIAGTTSYYNGATVAAPAYYFLNLVRTNNTPAQLSTGSGAFLMEAGTTMTKGIPPFTTSAAIYRTTNTNDTIVLYGSLSANVSAGAVTVFGASMTAVKLVD